MSPQRNLIEIMKKAISNRLQTYGVPLSRLDKESLSPSKLAMQEKDYILGPLRKAIHASIGGRILSDNELKLA